MHSRAWTQGQEKFVQRKTEMTGPVPSELFGDLDVPQKASIC